MKPRMYVAVVHDNKWYVGCMERSEYFENVAVNCMQ